MAAALSRPSAGFLELARKFLDTLTHDLASFKFHRHSRRNHEAATRLVRISPDAGLGQPRLKNAKVAQFNGDIVGQTIGDFIERALDHIKDFMLDHAGLIADGDNDVAFS